MVIVCDRVPGLSSIGVRERYFKSTIQQLLSITIYFYNCTFLMCINNTLFSDYDDRNTHTRTDRQTTKHTVAKAAIKYGTAVIVIDDGKG